MDLSVVMAVYNSEKNIGQAIDSILSQTYPDFIFYIVDDCSSDESARILTAAAEKDSRIKIITNQRHLGLTKSLNKALKLVKTPYIARMDSDDIALEKRFAKQISFLKTHLQIGLLGTAAYLIDSSGKNLGLKTFPVDHDHLKKIILRYCPFIHPTWMLRRSVLLEAGGYNEEFIFSQDYELALRLMKISQVANLAEPLIYYRVNVDPAISLQHLKQQEKLALKARFLALSRYNYPKTEAYKLIKPLLSFLFPVAIKKIVYRKFYWQTLLLVFFLALSGCQKTVSESVASIEPAPTAIINVDVQRAEDYLNWKYYSNNYYRYKLRYPYNWYFVDSENEPTVVTLSTQPQEKRNAPHASCQVEAVKRKNQTLNNFPPILELKATGKEARQFKIDKNPALFFDGLGPDQDLFSVFVEDKDAILRLNFGGNHKVNRDQAKDICLQIIASLEFF